MDDFKPFNLAQVYQSADASVANAMQSNMMVMQAQHMQRDYQDDQALRSAISGSLDPATGQMNLQTLMRNPVIASPKGQAYIKSVREAEKTGLDMQETKGKIAKQQHEEAVQLARGITSADEKDIPDLYVQMRQQAIDMGHEGAKKLPEQWNPALLPKLKALAAGDMSSKDAAERTDYRNAAGGAPAANAAAPTGTGATPIISTDLGDGGQPIDTNRPIIKNADGSFSTERTITVEADGKHFLIPTIVNGKQLSPEDATAAWRDGKNNEVGVYKTAQEAEQAAVARSKQIGDVRGQEAGVTRLPEETVSAKGPVETPEELRAQAAQKRTLATQKRALGTKVGADLAKDLAGEARDLETAASQIESRIQKDQDIEIARGNAATSASSAARAAAQQGISNANTYRDEFNKQSKVFVDVRDAYTRIQQSAKDPSAAGDMALIFGYMKVLDPGSTVREGEFATAQNATGVPDMVRNLWNRALNGERLNPTQRADFVGRAGKLYEGAAENHKKLEGEYSRLAKNVGVDPADVIVDYHTVKPGAVAGPTAALKAGHVEDGYRFKGGDPAKPESWEKQ